MEIIVYSLKTCKPCNELKMALSELNIKYTDIDINNIPKITDEIEVVPTILIKDNNGNILYKHNGAMAKYHLKKVIDKYGKC